MGKPTKSKTIDKNRDKIFAEKIDEKKKADDN